MPKIIEDDVRALDMLTSGRLDTPTAGELQNKLGLDDDDLRAWKLSTTANPDLKDDIQAKVLDKLRTKRADTDTALEAGVKGALQGVSFGFADEIESGLTAGFESLVKGEDFSKRYEERIKKEREELKRLEEKFPVQFISGELIGAVAVPIPGTGALRGGKALAKLGLLGLEKTARVASKSPRLLKLAGESALQAAGKSEAEFGTKQFFEETGKGTLTGVAVGGLLGKAAQKTSELVKKGISPAKRAAQVLSSILFDLPPSYTEKLLDKRLAEKVLNPKSSADIIEAIVGITRDMGKHARALSFRAQQKLSDEPVHSIEDVITRISKSPAMQKVERSTLKEARDAQAAFDDVASDLRQRAFQRDAVSEKDLKRFIQDLDEEIPWNKNEWKLKDKLFADVRSAIDNEILKRNQQYAKEMVPVAQIMSNLHDISKSFSLKRKGFETEATDQTLSKIKNFFDMTGAAKKPVTERALAQAEKRFLGPARPRILEDIQTSQIARRTEGGAPAGSKHILQGLAFGTLFGSPTFGAVAGAVKDRYGRKVGKSILPSLRGAIDFTDKNVREALKGYDPALIEQLMRVTGRTLGVGQGVGAAQTPSLLPTTPQQTLIPRR
jgi:hypothetical protein